MRRVLAEEFDRTGGDCKAGGEQTEHRSEADRLPAPRFADDTEDLAASKFEIDTAYEDNLVDLVDNPQIIHPQNRFQLDFRLEFRSQQYRHRFILLASV